jgi:hypothetical protein
VDAASLMGVRNYSSEDNGTEANGIAHTTFAANYPMSSRDVAVVTPDVAFVNTNNNITVNITASTAINTFFIRVMGAIPGMPNWDTLPVSSTAQATRPNLIMSLVLDRSGSMNGNDGAAVLPGAVSNFIDLFDDGLDRAAMVSFSQWARTDVTMQKDFKDLIKTAASALIFDNWTCSEGGLTNGLAENLNVNLVGDEKVVRVIVFFTDGMANTWYHNFDCGPRNISPDIRLWDPDTGADASGGCTVPNPITSIDGSTVDTTGEPNQASCISMRIEAQKRAEAVANLARSRGIIIYAIGLGNPNVRGECGGTFPVLNPEFLKRIANTQDSGPTYNSSQPEGAYAIATNAGELDQVFQAIGAKILSRLTK